MEIRSTTRDAGVEVKGRRGLAGQALVAGLGLFFLLWGRPNAQVVAGHGGVMTRQPIDPYLNGVFPPTLAGPFPPVLSQTGAFTDIVSLRPDPALIPFGMNVPLWSDGSLKTRWVALPNDGPPYAPSEQAGFSVNRAWTYPEGTVFVKHFELTINEITRQRRRLETRFLVRDASGAGYGLTYKWRDDQLEADLLNPGCDTCDLNETYTIVTATGTRNQTYTYPSRFDCVRCHNRLAGMLLGPKTTELNGHFVYPTGTRDNQLRVWNRLGMIYPPLDESLIPTYPRLVSFAETSVPLETRVRSYLDINCSNCHRPGGEGPTWDGRFSTPLPDQKIIATSEITPGNVAASQMYQRMNSATPGFRMPPLLKNVVHAQAVQMLQTWIGELCNGGPVFGGVRRAVSWGGCTIELTWTEALSPWCGSPVTYSIYRDTTPSFVPASNNRIAEGVTGSSFTDSFGTPPGVPYYYVVRAVNTGNGMDDGNVVARTAIMRGCGPSPSREVGRYTKTNYRRPLRSRR